MANTLRHGVRIIELLAQRPCSTSEVARHLQVDRSTARRLLQVLIEYGWVTPGSGTALFSLNVTHLYALAGNGHERQALPGLVMPTLTRIRDRVGESAALGVPSGSSMVYMVYASSHHAVTVREAVGSVRPMHASALGKAYLSALSEADLEQALKGIVFHDATPRAVKSVLELRQVVTVTREQGYATDIEECSAGVVCIGVPVRVGPECLLVGAIAVSGPRERLIMLGLEHVAAIVKEEVARMEENFARADNVLAPPRALLDVG